MQGLIEMFEGVSLEVIIKYGDTPAHQGTEREEDPSGGTMVVPADSENDESEDESESDDNQPLSQPPTPESL